MDTTDIVIYGPTPASPIWGPVLYPDNTSVSSTAQQQAAPAHELSDLDDLWGMLVPALIATIMVLMFAQGIAELVRR